MPPQFANAKAGEVGDVASLVGERINGWIRSYPTEATASALKDGVLIKGRPVDWAWAIPGACEYLVVEFSDNHKQYVARTELPEHATPAVTSAVALAVAPAVVSEAVSGNEETEEPSPDLASLADAARKRVFAWIRSCPLNANNCTLGDGSHVPGRPVGWAWAVPGTVEFMVVEFSDGHKQYLSPADLPEATS